MSSNLAIVSGTTRINLNERIGLFLEAGYYPSVDVSKKRLTETVRVQVRGGIQEIIQNINRLFARARKAEPAEEKVYVEYQVAEGQTAWRSRIWDGAVSVTSAVAREFPRGRVRIEIAFERDAFWEGPETALPIGNINDGVVLNCNDGSGTAPNVRTNAATITANLIEGDLPTPARLEIENQYNKTIGSLWVGLNKTRPNWLSGWMLEAEDAIGVTPVSAAGASGGAVAQGQLSYGSAQPILRWALDEALITMMRGQRLRLLLRPYYLGAYSVFKHKLKITSGVTPVYETDWIRPSAYYARHWLDMFDVRMPPWLEGKTDLAGLTLELWATPTRAGTWTWAFDDLMLFAQDGFVTLDTFTEPGGKIVIDGDQGWSEDAAGKKSGLRKFVGSLELTPMAFHLFYFAMHSSTMNDAPTDFAARVSGSYRPRRLTL